MIEITQVHLRDVAINRSDRAVLARECHAFKSTAGDARTGSTMMKQDWVKAIGKKLREDLGDCPTLPQELVDALGRLEKAQLTDNNLNRQTPLSKVGTTTKHEKRDRAIHEA